MTEFHRLIRILLPLIFLCPVERLTLLYSRFPTMRDDGDGGGGDDDGTVRQKNTEENVLHRSVNRLAPELFKQTWKQMHRLIIHTV